MLNSKKLKNKKNPGTKHLGNLAQCKKTKTMNNKNGGRKRNAEKGTENIFNKNHRKKIP